LEAIGITTSDTEYDSEALALEILEYSIRDLIVSRWYVSAAVAQLRLTPVWGLEQSGTDMSAYYFSPAVVIDRYRNCAADVSRDYYHSVLHCVFSHPFTPDPEDWLWDLAADIFVEAVADESGLAEDTAMHRREAAFAEIRAASKELTVGAVYRYLKDSEMTAEELEVLRSIFRRDIHDLWPTRIRTDREPESDISMITADADSTKSGGEEELKNDTNFGSLMLAQVQKQWMEAAQIVRAQLNLDYMQYGSEAGSLTRDIDSVYRTRYNYAVFLRRFASFHEEVSVNMDEFEYAFYTHGLRLYGNIPLIEPLEYREVKKIRDFVIVIDTSDSVSGEKVQSFLRNTYTVLSDSVSFFGSFNVHIIQCDASIQHVWVVRNLEEFEQGLSSYKLHGFGGTDFRPAFDYVDGQIKKKELTSLKGLIYFTDGKGTYPEKPPEYQTAFVFPDNSGNVQTPVWAVKLVLTD